MAQFLSTNIPIFRFNICIRLLSQIYLSNLYYTDNGDESLLLVFCITHDIWVIFEGLCLIAHTLVSISYQKI